MKTRLLSWLAFATSPFALQGAEISPFANFQGNFSKNAHVKVTPGAGGNSAGKIRQAFRIGKTGEDARLQVTGTLKVGGAARAFSVRYIFKRPDPEGARPAAITNLAPGVDDGYSADKGTYTVSPRVIRAEIPFTVGIVTGRANLVVRLERVRRGTRMHVTQTLVTDALPRPIIWRFRGLRSR